MKGQERESIYYINKEKLEEWVDTMIWVMERKRKDFEHYGLFFINVKTNTCAWIYKNQITKEFLMEKLCDFMENGKKYPKWSIVRQSRKETPFLRLIAEPAILSTGFGATEILDTRVGR